MNESPVLSSPTAGAEPVPGVDWVTFGPRLQAAAQRILFLDYDGTLAPFHNDLALRVPFPGVRDALTRLMMAGHTRVIIVTGRTIDTVLPLLGLSPAPETWGVHGWERREADGTRAEFDPGPVVREGLRLALEPASDPMWALWQRQWERKPTGLAFHFSGTPETLKVRFRQTVEPVWRELGATYGIGVHRFDDGLELRLPGRTKGTVVATVLEEAKRNSGGRPVTAAFLGDNFTDENAFTELANRHDPGLLGILVRPEWRTTAAQAWIRPPEELLDLLKRWNEFLPQNAQSDS
jgi:trehalose 6-phosphate phosphatase